MTYVLIILMSLGFNAGLATLEYDNLESCKKALIEAHRQHEIAVGCFIKIKE